jgi:ASC-1-like (ASCH) protein
MTQRIRINPPWIQKIREGSKKFEGRCYWKSIPSIRPGDILEVYCDIPEIEPYSVRVIQIHRFLTFRHALEGLGLEQTLPGVETLDQGVEIYHRFVSQTTQEANGVAMIEIELV